MACQEKLHAKPGDACGRLPLERTINLTADTKVGINVDMNKSGLTHESLSWLKNQILTFKLLPGVRISDKEVAEQLGISRSPVREALIHLAEQGLVEGRHNRGFTVKMFSIKEIEDLYTLRATLESMAVRLTTRHMDGEKAKNFQDLLDSYPTLMKNHDLVGFNDADEKFHALIAEYSDNRLLAQNMKNLQGQIRLARRYDHLRATSFQETYDEHHDILRHMIAGEAVKAQRAMSRHILRSMKAIINMLQQNL